MATSDPELKASLRRKTAEEMKRYRQRKKLKATTPVPCSNDVSESSDGKKSKEAPSIQKKEDVKPTQAQRMYIKLRKSQPMPNTLDENDSHEENRTNEDNISHTSMYRHMKKVKDILPQKPKNKAVILKKLIESPSTSKVLSGQGITLTPAFKKKTSSSR